MNIDTKILDEIVPNRMQQIMKYHDQMRFMPGMQQSFNVCKTICVIYNIDKTRHVILLIDVDKAYHKVQGSLMIKILQKKSEWSLPQSD